MKFTLEITIDLIKVVVTLRQKKYIIAGLLFNSLNRNGNDISTKITINKGKSGMQVCLNIYDLLLDTMQ